MPDYVISVLGGVVQDFTTLTERLPSNGETYPASHFKMQPGGKGSNSAVAIHRLTRPNPKNQESQGSEAAMSTNESSFHVRMVSAVGDDSFGPGLIKNLVDCGVNVDGVRVLAGKDTAVANILVESGTGANRILQYPGAMEHVEPEWFVMAEDLGGGVVPNLMVAQLELHRDAVEEAIETAGRFGIEVLLNPSPAHYLIGRVYRNVSHLIMNEIEAFLLAELSDEDIHTFSDWASVANHFHRLDVKNVVITLGEKGAFFSTKKGDFIRNGSVDAVKDCNVVDTSGAGDSFVGAYVAHFLTQEQRGEWDIKAAVEYSCRVAARVIGELGCLDQIPYADEIIDDELSVGIS